MKCEPKIYKKYYLSIIGKLFADNIEEISENEIYRILHNTVNPVFCIKCITHFIQKYNIDTVTKLRFYFVLISLNHKLIGV